MKKIISMFLVLIISLFADSQIANSIEETAIIEEKIQMEGIKDNKVTNDTKKSNYDKDDIFGDEQTFPFVAGLGKNAAH